MVRAHSGCPAERRPWQLKSATAFPRLRCTFLISSGLGFLHWHAGLLNFSNAQRRVDERTFRAYGAVVTPLSGVVDDDGQPPAAPPPLPSISNACNPGSKGCWSATRISSAKCRASKKNCSQVQRRQGQLHAMIVIRAFWQSG